MTTVLGLRNIKLQMEITSYQHNILKTSKPFRELHGFKHNYDQSHDITHRITQLKTFPHPKMSKFHDYRQYQGKTCQIAS
jgi:hypothetical protein